MSNQNDLKTVVPLETMGFWASLKLALQGSEADYTKISLNRAIFLLAIPMMLELMMESTFAIVDIFFVAQLGSSAVATVGLTETFLFLLYALAMGLSMSITAIIARRVGEKRNELVGVTAVQAISLGILLSLPVSFIGIVYAQDLLTLMGADEWTINHGYRYTQWMLGGNVVIMLLFVINAIYRGAGDAAIAMRVLLVANICNIVLDPLLIFGWGPIPAMGIEGAAIATNIGRGVGVSMQLWILFRGGKHIKVLAKHLRFHAEIMLEIVRTSLGGIGQAIIMMSSWIFLMRILAEVGSEAVAGATIAMRIMMFTLMPAWGLSNAVATLVGQNLGAQQPNRAESCVWQIGFYNMGFLLLISALFFFYHDSLIGIFTNDPVVIAIGGEWLKILSYSYFVYGWWMVATQAFNGAGDTITPTKINLVFFWMFQIPLAYVLAQVFDWQHSGVFWAAFVTETSAGIFTLWLFTRGKWKKFQL